MVTNYKLTFGIRSMLFGMAAVAILCAVYPVVFPPRPSLKDFAPQDTIDGRYTWKIFGGCSVAEAQVVFDQHPDSYIEEFGWMGDKAFVFYFPIVEGYVLGPVDNSKYRHCRRYYVASFCIGGHFQGKVTPEVVSIAPRVNKLASFVLENIDEIKGDQHERNQIVEAWTELKERSASVALRR